MSLEATLIYPNQLFREHPALKKDRLVILVEDPLFFTQVEFHKKKLAFHRASMKAFERALNDSGYQTKYLDSKDTKKTSFIARTLEALNIRSVFIAQLDDFLLEKWLFNACKKSNISITELNSPGFLADLDWSQSYFDQNRYYQTAFYIEQRKRLSILVDQELNPLGEKWSFDSENRKKLPKNVIPPKLVWPSDTSFSQEAKLYVESNFKNNPGSLNDIIYPHTHEQALEWLEQFLESRLHYFGDYQDSISSSEHFIFHSLLSAPLNIGLLTPKQIISAILDRHRRKPVPLNSLEGLIRQIIGWREYFRIIYNRESVKQRTTNYFSFKRKIPRSFWTAETGIEPVDDTIKRVLKNAYAHHIERLMVLGNFMLLCEFDPTEVYYWFMSLFIDGYDWVMVPNVYGMSQFSDGGLITTKPYVSSSNYILKMSNYKKDKWCTTWDALYWNFLDNQRSSFASNPRMSLMYRQLHKMDKDKLSTHKSNAEKFLETLN